MDKKVLLIFLLNQIGSWGSFIFGLGAVWNVYLAITATVHHHYLRAAIVEVVIAVVCLWLTKKFRPEGVNHQE